MLTVDHQAGIKHVVQLDHVILLLAITTFGFLITIHTSLVQIQAALFDTAAEI